MSGRVEQIGDCRLILGDCREWLLSVPPCFRVDAVITDPPYGIGFKYASHNDAGDGYGTWLWSVLEECEVHCQAGAPVFVFQAMPNVRHFVEWFPRDWRIYAAGKNFVQMRPTAMQYAFDPVICWWTEGDAWSAGTSNRDFYVADTAAVISNRRNYQRGHPCPRPLDQMMQMVGQWARPRGVVLDPFMGSGTTGVACVKLGRRFIGVEIEPKYFDIACRRIEDAISRPDIFIEAEKKAEQAALFTEAAA